MNKKVLWIAGGVLVAAAAGAVFFTNGEEELIEVQTAKVEHETIVQKVNATGRIQPKTQVRISADVSAKIMVLHVEEGAEVSEGQVLLEIDPQRRQLELANQRALAAQSRAQLADTEREQTRIEKLRDRGAVSAAQVDEARTQISRGTARACARLGVPEC